MDLFRFTYTPGADPTILDKGERINLADSKLWVERYSEPGEFTINAKLSSGLKELLPEGTLISHTRTMEVMIVENCEVKEDLSSDPEITITGRSFDTFMENRIVGSDLARTHTNVSEYWIASNKTWIQIVSLINEHISTTSVANDAIGNVVAVTNISGATAGVAQGRVLKPGELHSTVKELLAIDDLGIRTIRRNSFGLVGSSTVTQYEIYNGVDRSNKVIFSWKDGDLESANYLFSGKKRKNSALVMGRYVWTNVDTVGAKYNRRFMMVDASDIDGNLNAMPTGAALTTIISKMQTRGNQVLARQRSISISQTDVSPTSSNQYRVDYNLGDIVMLDGNFGQKSKMRVIEYAEVDDENGESGHPTLSVYPPLN